MSAPGTTTVREPRSRDRAKTEIALQLAIERINNSGSKLSIAAVAAEVGVTPGLIHNTYPDIADEVRKQTGRTVRQQRDAKIAELAKVRATLKEIRKELRAAHGDLDKLVSINETLRAEITRLKAQATGKVHVMPGPKGKL